MINRYILHAGFLLLLLPPLDVMGVNDSLNPPKKEGDGARKIEFVLNPGPGGKEQVGDLEGDPVKGEAVYKKYCVYCHGKEGFGDGAAAMGLNPSPAMLVNSFQKWEQRGKEEYKKLEQNLFEIVTYGSKVSSALNMPAWGPVLSREDRVHVLAYIKLILIEREGGN